MGNITRFAAINTKVKSLEGRLLKNQDYINLLEKKTVSEVVEYLKENTFYKEDLMDVDPAHIKVDALELLFQRHIVKQYQKFTHYFNDAYRKLFNIFMVRYQVSDLKLFLKTIVREEDMNHARNTVIYLGQHKSFDYEKISQSKTLEDAIENLHGTVYYELLKPYLNEEPEKRLFYMEMVLDKEYFRELVDQTKNLAAEDRKKYGEFLGKNIDLFNLQWIYRGLKFYKVSPEELINYTLKGGYYLNYRKLKDLCYTKTEDALIESMIDSKYGFLFDNRPTLEIYMERRIKRYLYFLLLENKKHEQMNIIEVVVYRHLLEYEMRDVISIMEAIKYGMNSEKTKEFLIRKIRGGAG